MTRKRRPSARSSHLVRCITDHGCRSRF